MIYPWHQQAWQRFQSSADRLPNAWLLVGKRHIGKTEFARHLAASLLCEKNHGLDACGECSSCHLASLGTHPDFYELTPIVEDEDNAKKLLQIKIEAVRQVLDNIHLTPLRAPRRVVLIHPAESMNIQAANALLKALEEPSETVIFILVAHHRDRLLPTIKSRCRQFTLPAPNHDEALAYLQQQQVPNAESYLAFHAGSPLFDHQLDAFELRNDLLKVLIKPRLLAVLDYAAQFDRAKQPLALFLDWLDKWLIDMIATNQGKNVLFYPQYQDELCGLSDNIPIMKFFALRDEVIQTQPYGQHTLNVKLVVESLLFDYLEIVNKGKNYGGSS